MIRVIIPFYSEFRTAKPGLRSMRDAKIPFEFVPIQSPLIYGSRNNGVNEGRSQNRKQEALEKFTHFLFIDSDIGFNAHSVEVVLAHNKPVVCLPYLRHENDGCYSVGEMTDKGRVLSRYHAYESGVKTVTWCGAGFLLVRREVFAKVEYPWFRHEMIREGESQEHTGEDTGFCMGLMRAGVQITCDFNNPVYHRQRTHADFDVSF